MFRHTLISTLFATALIIAPAAANDIFVTPAGSIQAAIDSAVNGDRVLVAAGTYIEQIDFMGKAISVIGLGGASNTTIDGGGLAPVVRFVTGETASSKLQGFSVTGGVASFGADGIGVGFGAAPTIEDCIVFNNVGKFGGGISGSPNLRRCVIRNNTASLTHGGGIYGAPQMKYCVVAGNTATSADGGGLYLNGPTTIEDCLFIGNRAIFADSKGGGIHVGTSTKVTIRRCVVADNSASGGAFAGVGGGIFAGPDVTITNCAVIGNSLTGSNILGGGIYGGASITNTIVRENTSPQLSSVGTVTYSDVEGGFAGIGNFDGDPLFVDRAGLDVHITSGSPCVDTGDPALFDPDGSRSDVGAYPFETLYIRSNSLPADWDLPSWPEISVAVGGRQVLQILAGVENANFVYLTAGSSSGTSPGVNFLGSVVPLNPDRYFFRTRNAPNSPPLSNSFGTLDKNGSERTTFTLAGNIGATYAGMTLHHATVVGTPIPISLSLVTNAAQLDLVQ